MHIFAKFYLLDSKNSISVSKEKGDRKYMTKDHKYELLNSEIILKDLEARKLSIEKQIPRLQKRIDAAPPGTLRIAKSHNHYQFFQKYRAEEDTGTYIPKSNQALPSKLAQKDYDTKLLEVLKQQHKVIDKFLKDFDPDAARQVYEKLNSTRKQLVKPEFLSDEEYIKQWMSVPYTRPPFKENTSEFFTAKGERVRSKSEILIADALNRHNIPYRCEFPVYSGGVIYAAPDFNCLNVRLRKEYYWEHLGKMGDEGYADTNKDKLDKYTLEPGFDETRLIITMETGNKPLNTKVIEEKIRKYLL